MTEIAPGMMVECIDDKITNLPHGFIKTNRYFVNGFGSDGYCTYCHSKNCVDITFMNIAPGACPKRFKPYGGDKEIEREQFQQLKSDLISEYRDKLMRQENG